MSFRPLNLGAPSAPSLYKLSVDEFKGVDKASGEDNFSPSRATEMQNFIRDKVGQVKKRGGFKHTATYYGQPVWVEMWHDYRITCGQVRTDVGTIAESWISIEKDGARVWGQTGDPVIVDEVACGYALGDVYYILYRQDGVDKLAVLHNGDTAITRIRALSVYSAALKEGLKKAEGIGEPATITIMPHISTPVIVEGASPAGGGSLMRSPNILSPLVTETFTVAESSCKRFQLSLQNISLLDGNVVIKSDEWMTEGTYWTNATSRTLTPKGAAVLRQSIKIEEYVAVGDTDFEWRAVELADVFKAEQKDFVNTKSAALWIPSAAIGASPVEGEPNVRITYIRNLEEYEEGLAELMACELSACYGVGGYKDRVFLAGKNKIFYSGMDDPMYFGELCYIEPCTADKSIVAMGGQGQVLYAVDSDGITHVISGTVSEDDPNTFLQDAAFIIADRVQGEKPVGSVLKIFGGEFCYLSEEGVVAIRHDNFYDKRYAQNRSRMLGDSIKGKIVGATVWGNFLVIATEAQLYLLDELQQTRLEDYKYSGVQYEVFPFAFSKSLGPFSITHVWAEDNTLCMCIFHEGVHKAITYKEDMTQDVFESNPCDIIAEWITPQFQLADVHRRKLIQELFLSVGAEGDAVTVEYRTDNEDKWRTIRPADGRFVAFDYNSVDYGTFSYNVQVPKLQMIVRGRPDRRFYKIQFRFTSTGRHGLSLSSFGFYYKKEVI